MIHPPPPPPPGRYSTGIWVGGFSRLNETLTLFKTQDVNFATLSKRKCCNFFTTIKTEHKFAFSSISTTAHEISENYVVEGEGKKESKRDAGEGGGGRRGGRTPFLPSRTPPPASFYKSPQVFRARCFPKKRSGEPGESLWAQLRHKSAVYLN